MTREAFIRKYLGNKRYEYNNADIDLMREDLDKVIDYHALRQPDVSGNEGLQKSEIKKETEVAVCDHELEVIELGMSPNVWRCKKCWKDKSEW